MSTRKGDWRDLLTAHSLAVDAKKLWPGFAAAVATIFIIVVLSAAHSVIVSASPFSNPAGPPWSLVWLHKITTGKGLEALSAAMPLLNPFRSDLRHLVLSILCYLLMLMVWTRYGGAISRLTALQYGRDEQPGLKEVERMVNDKRKAYFFCPVIPLVIVVLLALFNIILGLIGSIPYVGSVFMIPANLLVALNAAVLVFVIVLAVLSFGMMLPAISIGGKGAFEGFTSAYSYVMWGFNRFICYTLLAALLGGITTAAACVLSSLFAALMAGSLQLGLLGPNQAIVGFAMEAIGSGQPPPFSIADMSLGAKAAATVIVGIALCARVLVAGYAFSYFFTANTIICLLMRKNVDRIEIEEIYEHKLEEEEAPAPTEGAAEAEKPMEEKQEGEAPAEPFKQEE